MAPNSAPDTVISDPGQPNNDADYSNSDDPHDLNIPASPITRPTRQAALNQRQYMRQNIRYLK